MNSLSSPNFSNGKGSLKSRPNTVIISKPKSNVNYYVKRMLMRISSPSKHTINKLSEPLKLNIGAGRKPSKGWINVDVSMICFLATRPRFFRSLLKLIPIKSLKEKIKLANEFKNKGTWIFHDLNKGLPFLRDNQVAYIYASHILEHFKYEDAKKLLKECHRVLKHQGVIRISVPDLEKLVNKYLKGEKIIFLSCFFSDLRGSDDFFDRHKFMYDHEILVKLLHNIGFVNCRKFKCTKGTIPDLATFECTDDPNTEISLYVEAEKL